MGVPAIPEFAIPEKLDLVDLENAERFAQLALAYLGEPRACGLLGHVGGNDGRELAVGAAHDAGLDTAIGVGGERAAHRDRLVVGVRVHGHQTQLGICHHSSVIVTDRITSSLRIAPTTSMPLMTCPKRL